METKIARKVTAVLSLTVVLLTTIATSTFDISNFRERTTVERSIVPMFEEAFANDPARKIIYNPQFPPVGSVYVINFAGSAHIPTTDITESVSANLKLNLTSVKTEGIPGASLSLIDGELTLGDATYSLTHGSAVHAPVHRIYMKMYTENSLESLTVDIALVEPLAVSIDRAVGLIPADRERTGTIQIFTTYWNIDNFTGTINRIE